MAHLVNCNVILHVCILISLGKAYATIDFSNSFLIFETKTEVADYATKDPSSGTSSVIVNGVNSMLPAATNDDVQFTEDQAMLANTGESSITEISGIINGSEIEKIKNVYRELFSGYDNLIRPRLDQLKTVHILTKFVPLTIISLDTVSQVFMISGFFQLEWKDDVLAEARLNQTVTVPSSNVWLPLVQISKSLMKYPFIGNDELDLVEIRPGGLIKWVPEGIYSFLCDVNIQYYPLDVHTCTLTYYGDGETSSTVDLEYYGLVNLDEYVPNAQWDFEKVYQETRFEKGITFIDIHFVVRRRGTFEVMMTLIPILVMCMLSTFPLLLPISSGDKCIISIMIFFGYTIFMTVIIDTLPHNSLHMSYLVVFVKYLLSISICMVFYVIIQQKIYWDKNFGTFICRNKLSISADKKGPVANMDWLMFFGRIDKYVFIVFSSINVFSATLLVIAILQLY